MSGLDPSKPFAPLSIAVLTISDTRDPVSDKSGALLQQRIEGAGHQCAARALAKDDIKTIRAQVKAWIKDKKIDVVITTGGTGFTGRDVTPEAVEPLFEKRMDGFSIAFHQISFGKIGSSTIQSRATAGTANSTFIFCLPGSPGACRDAWDEILVHQLDLRHRPCNFVEILPRLNEHLKRAKAKK
jgi:molybdopterin adenylyltransferase